MSEYLLQCAMQGLLTTRSGQKIPVIARSAATRQSLDFQTAVWTYHHVTDDAMQKQPAVYLLTNKPNGTLYIGVTSDLPGRVWEHKNKVVKGFSERYNLGPVNTLRAEALQPQKAAGKARGEKFGDSK